LGGAPPPPPPPPPRLNPPLKMNMRIYVPGEVTFCTHYSSCLYQNMAFRADLIHGQRLLFPLWYPTSGISLYFQYDSRDWLLFHVLAIPSAPFRFTCSAPWYLLTSYMADTLFSSPELKGQESFSDRPLSGVRPSVCKLLHFRLLLQNHCANFNQT
jgi:hypothetical protein